MWQRGGGRKRRKRREEARQVGRGCASSAVHYVFMRVDKKHIKHREAS